MNPIRMMVVFAFLLTAQASAQGTADTCLLQKASNMKKASSQILAADAHQNWRAQHKLLLADTGESMDVLQQFIQQSQASGDACSARLLESKRILDGLLHDVKSLSTQVDSHEEVIETETGNLKITELSVKAVETTHTDAITQCDKEKQDVASRVTEYQSELLELEQIAKPSVRYSHVVKVTTSSETKVTTSETKEAMGPHKKEEDSLLQQGGWSKDSCLAFLSFQKKRVKHAMHEDPEKKRDCDAEREELQEAFTEAVLSTRDLLKEAQNDVEDTGCVDVADASKVAGLVPLVSERERASTFIESSTQSVASLQPVLDLIDSRVTKMATHISDVLTPECAEAKDVSEALTKIRELIISLEKCPGRNDFNLKIPEETEFVKPSGVDSIIDEAGGEEAIIEGEAGVQ